MDFPLGAEETDQVVQATNSSFLQWRPGMGQFSKIALYTTTFWDGWCLPVKIIVETTLN